MSEPQPTSKGATVDQNKQDHNKTENEQTFQIEAENKNKQEDQNEKSDVHDSEISTNPKASSGARCADTKISMSSVETTTTQNMKTPRITISEVVNSPSEEAESQGQRGRCPIYNPQPQPQPQGQRGRCPIYNSQPQPQPQDQRGRCPIYYGIKSYIHDFYQPPDKEVLKSGEYLQEDDFQFLVEPGKRRWRGWWLRVALWLGVNLMLVGIIAMLVGHLTTPRQTVVDQQDNFTVLDRWAVTFNNRLVICQLAGLAGFTSGAVIVMLALLVSSYQQDNNTGYYIMSATLIPQTFSGNPLALHRIPLSSSVRGVQPTFVLTR